MSGFAYDAQLWCDDCVPSDESGCECGRTDHNPQCAPYSDRGDDEASFCDECGVCIASGIAERELLMDSASGLYIPQRWANECASLWRGYDPEDVKILEAGPEHEHYWDAWADVLDNAECLQSNGKRWTLEQDGDCWAVRYVDEGDSGKLTPRPYALNLTEDGISAIEFASGRYAWADALDKLNLQHGLNRLTETEAHELHEAIESDDGWCPCLNPDCELAESLLALQSKLV